MLYIIRLFLLLLILDFGMYFLFSLLHNDALEKYYDHVLSTLFGNEFIYEFFNLMTNNSDSFDTFYNAYLSLPNTHILKKTLNELSLLKYDFIKVLFDVLYTLPFCFF